MEIQLAFIVQLSDSTEGLHGQFGHILISSGATAVLVFCGFVSRSNHKRHKLDAYALKHCIPLYTYPLKKVIITQYNKLQTMPKCCIAAGCSNSIGEGNT